MLAEDRTLCVAVVGCRKSGSAPVPVGRTSALAAPERRRIARVLSLCGATHPAGLLGATSDNPRGCFEPRAAIHLDESFSVAMAAPATTRPCACRRVCSTSASVPAGSPRSGVPELLAGRTRGRDQGAEDPMLTDLWFEAAGLAGFDVAALSRYATPR